MVRRAVPVWWFRPGGGHASIPGMTPSATSSGDLLAPLLRQLRAHLQSGADTMTLPSAQVRLLADELGPLLQGNDRLRRQNRRLRRKLQAATGEVLPEDGAAADAGDAAAGGDRGGEP